MNAWAIAALLYAALGLLALATDRIRREVPLRRPRAARAAGWLLLALALWPSVAAWGPSIGIAMWLGLMGLAAVGCTLLASYRPAWLPGAAAVGFVAGVAMLLSGR